MFEITKSYFWYKRLNEKFYGMVKFELLNEWYEHIDWWYLFFWLFAENNFFSEIRLFVFLFFYDLL